MHADCHRIAAPAGVDSIKEIKLTANSQDDKMRFRLRRRRAIPPRLWGRPDFTWSPCTAPSPAFAKVGDGNAISQSRHRRFCFGFDARRARPETWFRFWRQVLRAGSDGAGRVVRAIRYLRDKARQKLMEYFIQIVPCFTGEEEAFKVCRPAAGFCIFFFVNPMNAEIGFSIRLMEL